MMMVQYPIHVSAKMFPQRTVEDVTGVLTKTDWIDEGLAVGIAPLIVKGLSNGQGVVGIDVKEGKHVILSGGENPAHPGQYGQVALLKNGL